MIRSQFLGVGCAFVLTLLACGDDSVTGGSAEGGNAGGGAPPAGGAAAGGSGGEGAASSDGGAGGGVEDGGGGVGGSGGSPSSPNCELASSGAIDAACGVFVHPGRSGGDGSQAAPYGSLSEALAASGPGAFYVCGNGMVESASVSFGDAVYGSVNCDWSWGGPDLAWTAEPGEIPVIIQGNSSATLTKLAGMVVTAPATVAEGGSSVAVAASNANVELDRVSIIAADGVDGVNGGNGQTPAGAGGDGAAGFETNSAANYPVGGTSTCGRTGGAGGRTQFNAFVSPTSEGGDGIVGTPGGNGDNNAGGVAAVGSNGAAAAMGVNGQNGAGLGTIALTGQVGADGANGADGGHGNGGGGGGARSLPSGNLTGGAGGGGGCGGTAGTAGTAGGSSIAIISLQTTWSFSYVNLEAGTGGNGGAGGFGVVGSTAGLGLNTAVIGVFSRKGGNGSAGGKGGDGGGGAGGHAILIAYKGTAPDLTNVTTVTPVLAGAGGGSASDGVAALMQLFP